MADAIHIRAILEQNPYDSEAKRKLIEIGSLDDLKWLYKQYPYSSEIKRALLNYEPKKNNSNHHSIKKYDVFISHATEDKQSFVEPLANALKEVGIKVWYDGFVLEWGDGLRDSIDRGLVNSKYGIVVFSKAYLNKKRKWTKHELDGLFAKEIEGKKVILPIWHNITSVISTFKCWIKSR